MNSPIWHIDQQAASLRFNRFSAKVELDRPERGLTDVRIGPLALPAASLLGVGLPPLAEGGRRGALDCYQRGPDLAAAYRESQSWPVRADVLWHAVSPVQASGLVAGVDLIVSVRTELLDSWPELTVRSELAPTETVRLVDTEAARFEPCRRESCWPFDLQQGDPGCFAFRLPDVPFTYAEMGHPADFFGAVVGASGADAESVEVRYRLFAEHLEKGVILRARVRGVVVDRADDLRHVAACYAAFVAVEPPLGT